MRKIFLLSLLSLLFSIPFFTFAHGTPYLEFNPDKSNFLKDADVATPSQVFFAQNDFLGGFDIWVANPGSAGTAIFSLINEQGIVLMTKTVTIPAIAVTQSGTKFHVDLNSQLPVLADKKYSIQLTTSMPELRLYYSDRVQIISHNAPVASEYITGVAKLGAEEQIFSFKYVLYETNETSAPIVSNIGWTVVSPDQMRVNFNANEAIDYRIEYGPTGQGFNQNTDFMGDYEFCTQGISTCNISIPVSPNTSYQYTLTVKDFWGNQSQVTGNFTSGQAQTPPPTSSPTDLPPVISNLRIVDPTNSSVSVAWTTNEITKSHLLVSYSSNFIAIDAVSDPTLELEHFLLSNPILGPGTTYLATITSTDLGDNYITASISFTTLSSQPSPSPSITPTPSLPTPSTGSSPSPQASSEPTPLASVASSPPVIPSTSPGSSPQTTTNPQQGVTTSSIRDGTGTVNWSMPSEGEPSDGYRVDVFDKDGNLKKSIFVPSGSHQAEITDLEDEDYSVIVYENEGGVFKKIDKPKELKQEESFLRRLLAFWWALVPLLVGLGFLIWRNFRKTSQITKLPVS